MKVKGNLEDKKMAKEIGTVEEALQDLRDGKVILVIDDPERENEGDLFHSFIYHICWNLCKLVFHCFADICKTLNKSSIFI